MFKKFVSALRTAHKVLLVAVAAIATILATINQIVAEHGEHNPAQA